CFTSAFLGWVRMSLREGSSRSSSVATTGSRPTNSGAGSAAAPAARCRKFRRGSFISNPPSRFTSFNHLVDAQQERFRNLQPDRLCGRQIDDEVELSRLLDRKISRLRPAQNLVDVAGGEPV